MVVGARRSQGRLEDEWMRGWRVRVRDELLGDGDGTWVRRFALPPTYKTRTLSKIKNLLISAAKHRTYLPLES